MSPDCNHPPKPDKKIRTWIPVFWTAYGFVAFIVQHRRFKYAIDVSTASSIDSQSQGRRYRSHHPEFQDKSIVVIEDDDFSLVNR